MVAILKRLSWLMGIALAAPAAAQTPEAFDAPLPVDAAAEQRLLDLGGPDMRIRRTDHFVIAYNASDASLTALISRLEATHRSVVRFCTINDLPAHPLTRRLEVLFFETYEQYGRAADEVGFAYHGSSGFYSQRTNLATFYNILNSPDLRGINGQIEQVDRRMERLRKTRPVDRKALRARAKERARLTNVRDRTVERLNRTTVQHETAHQLFFNLGVHVRGARNPSWLVEGLACLFEAPPSVSGSGVGATNQLRLADFRRCVGNGKTSGKLKPEEVRRAIAGGKLAPLDKLVSDAALFGHGTGGQLIHHYSQAWALVCYLQRNKRDQFAEYLRLLSQRAVGQHVSAEQELADFQQVFGRLDDRFERRWASYVLTELRFKPSELR